MLFTAMKVSGGVDTRTLKFALGRRISSNCSSTYTTRVKYGNIKTTGIKQKLEAQWQLLDQVMRKA